MMELHEGSCKDSPSALWGFAVAELILYKITILYVVYYAVDQSSLAHRSRSIVVAIDHRNPL